MTLRDTPFRVLLCVVFLTLYDYAFAADSGKPDETRQMLAAQIEQNVQAGNRAMLILTDQSKLLDDDVRVEFEKVAEFVRHAERRLRRSLRAIATASADQWPRARSAVA